MDSRLSSVFFQAVLLVVLLVPSGSPVRAEQGQPVLRTEMLQIASGDRVHWFTVEIAETVEQRARGLMFRQEMPADKGMLFIFEGDEPRYFWMKNTPLPLDIIYIESTGRIVSIAADTTPYSEAAIPSEKPAKFALELNAGASVQLGIKAGDMVSSPSMTGD